MKDIKDQIQGVRRLGEDSHHTEMGVGGAPEVQPKLGAMKAAAGATGNLCLGPGSLR